MADLRSLAESIGLENVRTYIQSGNLLFESEKAEEMLTRELENSIRDYLGKDILVVIRTDKKLRSLVEDNPFPHSNPSYVGVMLFAKPVEDSFLEGVSTLGDEEMVIGKREVYINYPDGMGRSKLKLPKEEKLGTTRNINTLTKLLTL